MLAALGNSARELRRSSARCSARMFRSGRGSGSESGQLLATPHPRDRPPQGEAPKGRAGDREDEGQQDGRAAGGVACCLRVSQPFVARVPFQDAVRLRQRATDTTPERTYPPTLRWVCRHANITWTSPGPSAHPHQLSPSRPGVFLPLTVAVACSPLWGLALGQATAMVRGRKLLRSRARANCRSVINSLRANRSRWRGQCLLLTNQRGRFWSMQMMRSEQG